MDDVDVEMQIVLNVFRTVMFVELVSMLGNENTLGKLAVMDSLTVFCRMKEKLLCYVH